MKVAIGYKLQKGPWGGGNQFCQSLVKALEERGDKVRFDLSDKDIDIILLTDPRWRSKSISFGAGAIMRYLIRTNSNTLVAHRINECDERKATKNMNRQLRWANYVADHTIFIASWLKDLNIWQRNNPSTVITNGADENIFRQASNIPWDGKSVLKLVTHHWGGNWMKGFDVYSKIDNLLQSPKWSNQIEFTYIGNLPNEFRFQNSRYLPPLQGNELAKELSKHHVYITASINEPAGMHHIEGALSGLPILYRRSGALPEYCNGFGIQFIDDDFEHALKAMFNLYPDLKANLSAYPHTSKNMCSSYLKLFDDLLERREMILQGRHLWRSPYAVFRNLFLL